jgi:hypothetical protein
LDAEKLGVIKNEVSYRYAFALKDRKRSRSKFKL